MLAKALASASASAQKVYVEDVFSTWLYTGNSSTQTITNGIDLSGKGGLVWTKNRSFGAYPHSLIDTARGINRQLSSNTSGAEIFDSGFNWQFSSAGYSFNTTYDDINNASATYASWTFRKQAKFFDVVTWTGSGTARNISHNLGSAPGCVIVKRTDSAASWQVWHRSTTQTNQFAGYLNSTGAFAATGDALWGTPTTGTPNMNASTISIGDSTFVNASGGTYVAYLFAHDAGGFGDSGNESVIKCGGYTGNGTATGPFIDLGWEPQWILIKNASSTGDWVMIDNMRGFLRDGNSAWFRANLANAEAFQDYVSIGPTGFNPTFNYQNVNTNGSQYVYIAIRRGPMKTPTDATKVFDANKSTNATAAWTPGFPVDVLFNSRLSAASPYVASRLTGKKPSLRTSDTAAEYNDGTDYYSFDATTNTMAQSFLQGAGDYLRYSFRRAPGFFDVVAYTGTGSATTISHNLGVAPELMLVKARGAAAYWRWYWASLGATKNFYMPNNEAAVTQTEVWNNTAPTSSVFTVGTSSDTNFNGRTYVAYLFATCPGVSKCFNYTGTGTTKQIDCGFTNGARFVMIKRTDSTGDWYVWDSARGIISGNDPYLLLNSTAAEVTNTDYIDPYSAGFEISSTAPAAINANGGSYIGLAIA